MKIYTKTGDKGTTSLFDGTRVSKFNKRVETYGTIDELNSVIGIVVSKLTRNNQQETKKELTKLQHTLFDIGAKLADPTRKVEEKFSNNLKQRVEGFEKFIDEMTEKMPPITGFILPGGGEVGSFFHLARTITRRVERRLVELSKDTHVDSEVLQYFNRLSDLFFTMSRYVNFKEKKKEIKWQQHK